MFSSVSLRSVLYHFGIAVWRAKEAESRRVKHWESTLAVLALLSASLALADDFRTISGKEYKNVTVSRIESDGIVLKSKSGITKLYFVELSKDVQEHFDYDSAQGARFTTDREGNGRTARCNVRRASSWRNR